MAKTHRSMGIQAEDSGAPSGEGGLSPCPVEAPAAASTLQLLPSMPRAQLYHFTTNIYRNTKNSLVAKNLKVFLE